ncbi:3'(2'),5'-bisphosphate nucleotidase CysQ [Fulvimonas soli]|jgi:3'(2'), 5'-bisphosphate nucleotidase|uniref:3'(2'),5'-bisphosphate nucleotidase CysQ n=1 Tax=Fulvimonas soli TaxID=155197 RepID=A0A316HVU2_9GAMM|nr:3'(2'),5'-bisphosphate nucleotidase CysQ [Fulvimonas soli]PWK84750.1 3'(2'),5'-bisphosphate nucleotidase [Fulvimonas soli]TNY27333.1 3'(2'),5'-bisphosphate nucleotidase [Fulvimonas soli]
MSDGTPASALLHAVAGVARQAGQAILDVYEGDFAVERKADASPLTAADLAAQRVILDGLAGIEPALPVLSEEARAAAWGERRAWPRYWLVDPLDGTREFVKRNGEFTVNIALVEGHRPVLGVVLAPVTGELYAAARGEGAWLQAAAGAPWQALRTRALASPPVAAGSRSHGADTHAMLAALLGSEHVPLPMGSSLKFCLIARGDADLYLRLGATSEWDTAAAQCVLEEAGGAVLDLAGDPLRYNTRESLTNPEFLAVGDTDIDWAARLRRAGPGADA